MRPAESICSGWPRAPPKNATLVTGLIEDLVERGLSAKGGLLFVIDGAKALRAAISRCFGQRACVQRCQVHKARNVAEHLPRDQHAFLARKLVAAWRDPDQSSASSIQITPLEILKGATGGMCLSLPFGAFLA